MALEFCVFSEPQEGATFEQLARLARRSEELGFAGFFRSDHYLKIHRREPGAGPTDAWLTLAGLALETRRIRLGTLVTCATFRLPGPLSIAVAQVDQMSRGRLDLGIGAGWYDAEHRAYGIPFPGPRERFERLEEQLEILTGLWETPEDGAFTFQGRHYQLEAAPALPRPSQRPGPPIVIGGMGRRRTPRLAATYASEFNVAFRSVAEAEHQFQLVAEACRARGRDPATLRRSVALTACCGRDEADLERRLRELELDWESLGRGGAAGTPEQVVERVVGYAALGCERIYLQLLDAGDLAHLELLAETLLPLSA